MQLHAFRNLSSNHVLCTFLSSLNFHHHLAVICNFKWLDNTTCMPKPPLLLSHRKLQFRDTLLVCCTWGFISLLILGNIFLHSLCRKLTLWHKENEKLVQSPSLPFQTHLIITFRLKKRAKYTLHICIKYLRFFPLSRPCWATQASNLCY